MLTLLNDDFPFKLSETPYTLSFTDFGNSLLLGAMMAKIGHDL